MTMIQQYDLTTLFPLFRCSTQGCIVPESTASINLFAVLSHSEITKVQPYFGAGIFHSVNFLVRIFFAIRILL